MDEFSKQSSWNEKLTTAEEALSSIQSGNRIFVGTACATPRTLIKALESSEEYLADVRLLHFLTDGAILAKGVKTWTRFWHRVFFVGTDTREAIPIVALIEEGVITGKAKSIHKGEVVTSYCMGTRRLYDLVDDNPFFFFAPMEYVSDPALIAANSKMVSVTQAFAIDLTGQVCADQFDGEFYGGVSTQPDFLRGAASSPGGKAIVCLASTTRDGEGSRIRPLLKEGEGVTIARSDIHYVVTEYGSTYLFGKSIRERALSLIEIAHPSFRPWLLDEAKRFGYVSEERSLRSSVAYPVDEEREVVLRNKVTALIRPSRASDVERLQELFYNLSEQDVYTRFFAYLRSLSVSSAQQLCSVNYKDEMAFLAVVEKDEEERIIGSSCYVVDPSTNMAEVAYMIHPQWQENGVGKALQQRMIEYARSKGLRGFTAGVLGHNERMIRLIEKSGCSVSTSRSSGVWEITMTL